MERIRFYSNSLRFDISIVQCLGVYFLPDTVYIPNLNGWLWRVITNTG